MQHVVHENDRRVQVLHEIVKGLAHRRYQHGAVGLRGRQQHVSVDHLVDAEDRPVGVFQRIVERFSARGGRTGRGAPADGESESQQARDEERRPAQQHHEPRFKNPERGESGAG